MPIKHGAGHTAALEGLSAMVKAKLEAVDSGITSFEHEFMAHIVMPDGKTVSDHALPMIAAAYQSGKVQALLPGW